MADHDAATPSAGKVAPVRVAEPDLRVSDAERDQAVSALGRHFQAGRLDQAEFDERMTSALGAKTRRDLRRLLADLPPDGQPVEPVRDAAPSRRGNPLVPLLPLAIVAMVIFGGLAGRHHGAAGWTPLWWLWIVIPIIVARLRIAGQRRQ